VLRKKWILKSPFSKEKDVVSVDGALPLNGKPPALGDQVHPYLYDPLWSGELGL
jgi:hypothetical protein